jgi:hypothetical protein
MPRTLIAPLRRAGLTLVAWPLAAAAAGPNAALPQLPSGRASVCARLSPEYEGALSGPQGREMSAPRPREGMPSTSPGAQRAPS